MLKTVWKLYEILADYTKSETCLACSNLRHFSDFVSDLIQIAILKCFREISDKNFHEGMEYNDHLNIPRNELFNSNYCMTLAFKSVFEEAVWLWQSLCEAWISCASSLQNYDLVSFANYL